MDNRIKRLVYACLWALAGLGLLGLEWWLIDQLYPEKPIVIKNLLDAPFQIMQAFAIAGAITLSGLVLTYLAILCLGTAYYTIKGEEEV